MTRVTHTYALLEVSPAAFAEMKAKFEEAGYQHAFHTDDGKPVIDMHGIALVSESAIECCHGVPLEHNCNACSDEAARGGRPNPR